MFVLVFLLLVKSWPALERQCAKDVLMPFPFRYDVEIGTSTSIMGPSISPHTREVLTSHLSSYNMWALQGTSRVSMGLGGWVHSDTSLWSTLRMEAGRL